MPRRISSSSASDTSGRCSRADGGSALMWAHIFAISPVSPAKGAVPTSVSKSTQASP